MSQHNHNEFREIISGIFLTLGMNILASCFYLLIARFSISVNFLIVIPVIGFFGIGLTQLIYVIPVVLNLHKKGKWGKMKGVIIGAVITALLNGSCFLIFVPLF